MQPKPWESQKHFTERKAKAKAAADQLRHNFRTAVQEDARKRLDTDAVTVLAHEYIKHGNMIRALIATGFSDENMDMVSLTKIARQARMHPQFEIALDKAVSSFTEHDILTRDRVLAGLFTEAADRESGLTSGASRVAAWSKLSQLTGLDAEAKRKAEPEAQQIDTPGGVLLIPFVSSIEEWEQAAIGQQAKLKEDVRN